MTAAELLAILIGTGIWGNDALVVAQGLLRVGAGSLRELGRRPTAELVTVPGVGRAKAARVAAALELARRLSDECRNTPYTVKCPADVHRWCAPAMRDLTVEEFRLIALDSPLKTVVILS